MPNLLPSARINWKKSFLVRHYQDHRRGRMFCATALRPHGRLLQGASDIRDKNVYCFFLVREAALSGLDPSPPEPNCDHEIRNELFVVLPGGVSTASSSKSISACRTRSWSVTSSGSGCSDVLTVCTENPTCLLLCLRGI